MQIELMPHAIPNFLTSQTPQGLRRAMLRNNARLGGWVRYYDMGQVSISGRLVFIAWFYEPIESNKDLEGMLGNGSGK
jgi:hypothetical protein